MKKFLVWLVLTPLLSTPSCTASWQTVKNFITYCTPYGAAQRYPGNLEQNQLDARPEIPSAPAQPESKISRFFRYFTPYAHVQWDNPNLVTDVKNPTKTVVFSDNQDSAKNGNNDDEAEMDKPGNLVTIQNPEQAILLQKAGLLPKSFTDDQYQQAVQGLEKQKRAALVYKQARHNSASSSSSSLSSSHQQPSNSPGQESSSFNDGFDPAHIQQAKDESLNDPTVKEIKAVNTAKHLSLQTFEEDRLIRGAKQRTLQAVALEMYNKNKNKKITTDGILKN